MPNSMTANNPLAFEVSANDSQVSKWKSGQAEVATEEVKDIGNRRFMCEDRFADQQAAVDGGLRPGAAVVGNRAVVAEHEEFVGAKFVRFPDPGGVNRTGDSAAVMDVAVDADM